MKKIFAFAVLSVLLLTLTWAFASEDLSQQLNQNIVRLHILANSDSENDQALKLAVRDRLLAEAGKTDSLLSDEEILSCCKNELQKQGAAYEVTLERGRFHFPQKNYANLTLPAGDYNAVRIIIGEGEGQNWWCVMYPPLCFSGEIDGGLDTDALQKLQSSLGPEACSVIFESDTITIKPSFKLLELWQELKAHTAAER